ncbi:tRNA (cytidine(34)-2'-O)-methyltransferase [Dichotomicrobium thermohalophilum]|uniref:tRNA (cytidine(34)-2'-O)-methyltransferase n=1 Tax=Dichotomicrobium thermohalophilum TaxID=933063 RepID=A0A397PAH9_9HYPH|nr:tRNA (cytidine(34)-2'-O)-methyltransferase [Dichotomicrobium thermohalophilum]RIA45393.1 tRNA (cytidine/uridine-2'-O-)-methyltransferase [Dichotomicrobium thermohalophilum]
MRLALYQPDIAQNTGTILRLAACVGVPVSIIAPAGFDMSDRALRRAGLDYLQHVTIDRHPSFEAFQEEMQIQGARIVLLTRQADRAYVDFAFQSRDVLLLGRESAGVPDAVHDAAAARVTIPMRPELRSLNVAVAAAMVLGEGLRQTNSFPTREMP